MSLRLCVLVQAQPTPSLIDLRPIPDGRVVLGCVVDARQRVHRWLELWIQDPCVAGQDPTMQGGTLNNQVLDDRWRRLREAFEAIDVGHLLATAWDDHPATAAFIDPEAGRVLPLSGLADESGNERDWSLCRDDAVLEAHGLPAYRSSLHRYLAPREASSAQASVFIPLDDEAPRSAATMELDDLPGFAVQRLALNPRAGCVIARTCSPLTYEQALDVLGTGQWHGRGGERRVLDLVGGMPALAEACGQEGQQGHEAFFLAGQGQAAQLLEALYLKLGLLRGAVNQVHHATRATGQPLLNLAAESFHVDVPPPRPGVAIWWTATTRLMMPGAVREIAVGGADGSGGGFLALADQPLSIYRPRVGSMRQAQAVVRLRRVDDERAGVATVEGTLRTQEPIEPTVSDVVSLRIVGEGDTFELPVRLERNATLAADEFRFRTIDTALEGGRLQTLRSLVGIPLAEARLLVVPRLSSPFDLYSLAVLAVRSLLVDEQTPLPVVLDALMSLAHQLEAADESDSSSPPGPRITALAGEEPGWRSLLGPHRLIQRHNLEPEQAWRMVPEGLWCELLGLIARLLPGVMHDSFCRDYADAPPDAPHRIFEPVLDGLDHLLRRTRGLLIPDPSSHAEVQRVIDELEAEAGVETDWS